MSEAAIDRLLRALADGTRRALLDRLRDHPGVTLTELLEGLPQSRQALSKHLSVLEEVELVVPIWSGREKRHYLNPAPLQALPTRWITSSAREDAAALSALERALETNAAATPRLAPTAVRDPLLRLLLERPAATLRGQSITNSEELQAAIQFLSDTAEAMRGVLERLSPEEGYDKPADGTFSLVEHVWHLAEIEELGWQERFRRILAEKRPQLPGVDGDRLAAEHRYQSRPWRGAGRRFIAARKKSLASLRRFDEAILGRPVRFAGDAVRAGSVLAAAVAHDLDHRPLMAERIAHIPSTQQP
ncbi:MAG: helix-turn-helix domain-containing protein [Candidatus Eisenbacteria bacterium]|nr:helix-turn-helix domain-containing protein [Candidatus Eisenbacteria bacterium]